MNLIKNSLRRSQVSKGTLSRGASLRSSEKSQIRDGSVDHSPTESPAMSPEQSARKSMSPEKSAIHTVGIERSSRHGTSPEKSSKRGSEKPKAGRHTTHSSDMSPSAPRSSATNSGSVSPTGAGIPRASMSPSKTLGFAQSLTNALRRTKRDQRERRKKNRGSEDAEDGEYMANSPSDSGSRTPPTPPTPPAQRVDILAILKDLQDEKEKNAALNKMLEESQNKEQSIAVRSDFLEKENVWLRGGASGPQPVMPKLPERASVDSSVGSREPEHLAAEIDQPGQFAAEIDEPGQLAAEDELEYSALMEHQPSVNSKGSADSMFAVPGKTTPPQFLPGSTDSPTFPPHETANRPVRIAFHGNTLEGPNSSVNAPDFQVRIEELKQRNEELSMQLASAHETEAEIEAQANKSADECRELMQTAEGLHTESEELRDSVARSKDAEMRARRCSADFSQRSEELFLENAELQTKVHLVSEGERRVQQLQRECSELRERLAVAHEASNETSESMEEDQRRIKDLQRECGRLREKVAAAEADCMASDQENPSLRRDCDRLREQVASAMEVEAEVGGLVEVLREQVASSLENERDAREFAAERANRCEQLEARCAHLQEEATACGVHVHEVDGDQAAGLRKRAVEQAPKELEELVRAENERRLQLLPELERLRSEAAKASEEECQARHYIEDLLLKNQQLREEYSEQLSCRSGVAEARASPTHEHGHDDGAVELELWTCVEEGLHRNQLLQRDIDQLRNAVAEVSQAELEARRSAAERLEVSRQWQQECAHLRDEANAAAQAERDARGAIEAGLFLQEQLERKCEDLQEQAVTESQVVARLREQVARSTQSERMARKSADAARELLRRKEELQKCKQLKDQVVRAVEAEREARKSAEVAVGLRRLIKDLDPGTARCA